jgi:hypothetical protein
MSARVLCPQCRNPFTPPESGGSRTKVRCPNCQFVVEAGRASPPPLPKERSSRERPSEGVQRLIFVGSVVVALGLGLTVGVIFGHRQGRAAEQSELDAAREAVAKMAEQEKQVAALSQRVEEATRRAEEAERQNEAMIAAAKKAEPSEGKNPGKGTKPKSQDLGEYTKLLKEKIPFDIEAFKKTGMTAETYVKDEKIDHFLELVVRVEPVYLTDRLTGKTSQFTRARLVRNNPAPAIVNPLGGVRRAPELYAWASIQMLP